MEWDRWTDGRMDETMDGRTEKHLELRNRGNRNRGG